MQTIVKYLEEHKNDYDYTEAIIAPNGMLEYANIGHQNELAKLAKIPVDAIWDMMPISANALSWLVEYTGHVSLWSEFAYIPENYTKEQLQTISILQRNDFIRKNFFLYLYHELYNCEIRENIFNGKAESKELKPIEKLTISEARKRLKNKTKEKESV